MVSSLQWFWQKIKFEAWQGKHALGEAITFVSRILHCALPHKWQGHLFTCSYTFAMFLSCNAVNRIVALLSLPHSWCLTDLQFTSVVLKKAHEFYPYTVKRSAFWDETCSHTSLFCLLSMRIRTELQNFQFTWWSSQKAGLVLSDAAGQKFCFHVLFHSTQNLLCSEAVH